MKTELQSENSHMLEKKKCNCMSLNDFFLNASLKRKLGLICLYHI